MKRIFLLGCAICFCQVLFAQDTVLKREYYIKARVWETTGKMHNLYLADINDTAVILSAKPISFRRSFTDANALNYQQIDIAVVKRRGSVGRGILFGSLSGMVLGGLVGAITYRKCDECIWDFGIGGDIAAGAILGTGSGALIGGVIGALAQKRFVIGGNKQKFDQLRLSVLDMAYRPARVR